MQTHTVAMNGKAPTREKDGHLASWSGYGAAIVDFQDERSSERGCFQLDFLQTVSVEEAAAAAEGLCLACTDNPPITVAEKQSEAAVQKANQPMSVIVTHCSPSQRLILAAVMESL